MKTNQGPVYDGPYEGLERRPRIRITEVTTVVYEVDPLDYDGLGVRTMGEAAEYDIDEDDWKEFSDVDSRLRIEFIDCKADDPLPDPPQE